MFHLALTLKIIKDLEYLESATVISSSGPSSLLAAQTTPKVLRRGGKTVHLQFPYLKEFYLEQVPNGSFSNME